jgi:hypothetical protein
MEEEMKVLHGQLSLVQGQVCALMAAVVAMGQRLPIHERGEVLVAINRSCETFVVASLNDPDNPINGDAMQRGVDTVRETLIYALSVEVDDATPHQSRPSRS